MQVTAGKAASVKFANVTSMAEIGKKPVFCMVTSRIPSPVPAGIVREAVTVTGFGVVALEVTVVVRVVVEKKV
jgi:hypothetical protein